MKSKKTVRSALGMSVLSIALCAAMLIGTTFAWFTDTATASVNKIQAGTLDVDIIDMEGNSLDGKTMQFKDANENADILWEPGCTFYLEPFMIQNKGNLALKYQIKVNGVNGDSKLLEALEFGFYYFSPEFGDARSLAELEQGGTLDNVAEYPGLCTAPIYLFAHMKETAGNEYQGLSIDGLGITVVATQSAYEYDSEDNTYDENAEASIQVNPSNIQDYLDGKYGSINGMTLVLAEGEYDTLTIGGVAADTKGDIVLTCNHTDGTHYSFTTAEEYKAHVAENVFHFTSTYTRTMSNVTFVGNRNVTVKGVLIESGHLYQYVNPFSEKFTGYYMNHKLTNFTFSGINFSGNVNINTSSADTVLDGFTFDNCTFTTNGTDSSAGQAIRYYNENNNGQVKNLVVNNCTFTSCYQGVYTAKVRGISVTGCTFDTTGHNAIAVQGENANHGAVVITGNRFTNIGDRIIRFNVVGADTQITIQNNTATNSGDSNGEVIKATALADGITYSISDNSWGENTIVFNKELADR